MKGVRTVFAVLLFLMVTIDIFVNCANEKGKTEEDPQSSVIKQEKQKPPEAAPAEIGQSAFDTAARHEEMALFLNLQVFIEGHNFPLNTCSLS